MAESTDSEEDRLSCDDSSYGERNLEVFDGGNGVHSGSEDGEYGDSGTDRYNSHSHVQTTFE